jgi:hypothetical protein
MSTLYISEHTAGTIASSQVSAQPPIAEQTVSIGGGSQTSAPFNEQTKIIRVHCDAICSIAIGKTPTASANNARLAANQTEYFSVKPGDAIAVIQNT